MPAPGIGLSETARAASVALLQVRLAAAIDLNSQAKQAHWNVGGPRFLSLHKLFGVVAGEAGKHSDLIARRIAMLGGLVEGTARVAAKRSELPVYPLGIRGAAAHTDALAEALAGFGLSLRSAVDPAAAIGDHGTAEMLAELTGNADRLLWLVDVYARGDT